jgi:hypothetical protein
MIPPISRQEAADSSMHVAVNRLQVAQTETIFKAVTAFADTQRSSRHLPLSVRQASQELR